MKSPLTSLKLEHIPCPMCGREDANVLAKGQDFEYGTCTDEFTFVLCSSCNTAYLNPRPSLTELERIYPQEYAPYQFSKPSFTLYVRNFLEGRKVRKISQFFPPNADIIDVGCGGAGFLENLRKYGSPKWRLWGNDINEDVIKKLKKDGYKAIQGRFEEIDLPEATFYGIFMKQVIEHLDTPRAVLNHASYLLRSAGRLIIETPNLDSWDARIFQKRYWGGYHFPRHWTIFTPQTLSKNAKEAGLEVEEINFMMSPSFWVQSVHHLLKEKKCPELIYKRFTHLNPIAVSIASMVDVLQMIFRGTTSNMQIIFRKPC